MFNRLAGANIFKCAGERIRPKDAVTTRWSRGGFSDA